MFAVAPPTEAPPVTGERANRSAKSFGPLLLRMHFYAGILVAPFLLVAALTGLAYVFVGLPHVVAAPPDPRRPSCPGRRPAGRPRRLAAAARVGGRRRRSRGAGGELVPAAVRHPPRRVPARRPHRRRRPPQAARQGHPGLPRTGRKVNLRAPRLLDHRDRGAL
ncbi:PepSY-associated TM helix domain-containing protein [Actinoplanes sp. LAM7112]|uniref:PepSY domain-containing protein n=1 Tax=Actinoplanes solisilvae TaxID=2486853 RepID=UPI0013E37E39